VGHAHYTSISRTMVYLVRLHYGGLRIGATPTQGVDSRHAIASILFIWRDDEQIDPEIDPGP
jgi:hypothetical protein